MAPKGSVGKVSGQECCSQCGAIFEVPQLFSVCTRCVFHDPRFTDRRKPSVLDCTSYQQHKAAV